MLEALLNTSTFLAGGASFLLLGFFFAYFPSLYRKQIEARNANAQKLRREGESLRADRVNDETKMMTIRTPKYGVAMIAFGAVLMAVAPYLKK
jgi:hypothetical protein